MITKIAERQIRAAIESQMTTAEAERWAEQHQAVGGRWPVRRFRAEKTSVGNSPLATRHRAEQLVKMYGGEVVEVILPLATGGSSV